MRTANLKPAAKHFYAWTLLFILTAALMVTLIRVSGYPYAAFRGAGIITCFVGQTVFIAMYATVPWWRNYIGQALFLKSLSFWLLTLAASFGVAFNYKYEDEVLIALYWVVAATAWYQAASITRQRREAFRQEMGKHSSQIPPQREPND